MKAILSLHPKAKSVALVEFPSTKMCVSVSEIPIWKEHLKDTGLLVQGGVDHRYLGEFDKGDALKCLQIYMNFIEDKDKKLKKLTDQAKQTVELLNQSLQNGAEIKDKKLYIDPSTYAKIVGGEPESLPTLDEALAPFSKYHKESKKGDFERVNRDLAVQIIKASKEYDLIFVIYGVAHFVQGNTITRALEQNRITHQIILPNQALTQKIFTEQFARWGGVRLPLASQVGSAVSKSIYESDLVFPSALVPALQAICQTQKKLIFDPDKIEEWLKDDKIIFPANTTIEFHGVSDYDYDEFVDLNEDDRILILRAESKGLSRFSSMIRNMLMIHKYRLMSIAHGKGEFQDEQDGQLITRPIPPGVCIKVSANESLKILIEASFAVEVTIKVKKEPNQVHGNAKHLLREMQRKGVKQWTLAKGQSVVFHDPDASGITKDNVDSWLSERTQSFSKQVRLVGSWTIGKDKKGPPSLQALDDSFAITLENKPGFRDNDEKSDE